MHSIPALEGTSFGLAYKAGAMEWTPQGPMAVWYPDIQITNVLHNLTKSRTTYTDALAGVRLRRNLLVQGPHGWAKSSAVKLFAEKAIGVRDFDSQDECAHCRRNQRNNCSCLRVFLMKGRGNSAERLRGSVSADGDILEPVYSEADYLLIPELKSGLGIGTNDKSIRTDMADNFLEVLEEDEGSVNLIKITGADIDAERSEELRRKGIHVNRGKGTMRYRIISTAIGCTTFFTPEQRKLLMDNGFLDRWFPSRFLPSDKDSVDLILTQQRKPDLITLRALRDFNDHLSAFAVDEVDAPPWDMVKEVLATSQQMVREVVSEGYRGYEVVTGRDQTTAYQLLTAAAFERTVREWKGIGFVIPSLQYDERDIEVATWYFRRYVQARMMDVLDTLKPNKLQENDLVTLNAALKTLGKLEGITGDELAKAVSGKSKATYFRWRRRCVDNGYLTYVEGATRKDDGTYSAGLMYLKWHQQQAENNWGVSK